MLIAVTECNGNKVTFTYSGGSLSKITGADGVVLTVSCSGGKLKKITDPLGRSVNYTYDSKGRLTKVSGEVCGTTTYSYDEHGITSITDGNGCTYIENVYDSRGRVVKQTDEAGRQYKFVYNDEEQENSIVATDSGSVTRYRYNEKLYVTRINYQDGSFEKFEYDSNGNRTMVRERSGYVTRYTYDAEGNVTSVINPVKETTTFQYNSDGLVTKAVLPRGGELRFVYDDRGNMTKQEVQVSETEWAETVYAYDEKGRLISCTDAEGGKVTYTYDTMGEPIKEVNELGGITTYSYDKIGRCIEISDSLGKTIIEYNSQDLVTSVTAADGGITRFVYDAIGNLTKLVRPEQTEQAVEDGLTIEEAKGYTYSYDFMDRLVAECSPEEIIRNYTYDISGNMLSESRPEYTNTTVQDEEQYLYTYDSVGNVVEVTAPDGGITTYAYDAGGNMTSVTYPDGQATGASVQYTYDALNRVISVTDTLGKTQYKYAYDADGNISSVTDAMGYTTYYQYSLNGNLLEVREPKKEEKGQVWYQIFRYTYNKNGQVLTAESSAEFVTQTGLPTAWDKVTYTYDAAGNVISMKDSAGGGVSYTYDKYSQLLKQQVLNGVTDPVTTSYTYTNMGSVAESEGYWYAYDLNGNLIKVTTPSGAVTRYIYDAADRLIRTEEDVQVDTLDIQTNSARIQLLEGRDTLYPKNSFMCVAVVDLETTAKGMEVVIYYEADLLAPDNCVVAESGVSVDTSTPGIIRLTKTGNTSKGEHFLCYIIFTAKEEVTGSAYVAMAPESTLTNSKGTFLFSECTGLLMNVSLPDYNGDTFADLRDFTLLAKQHGQSDETAGEQYDITGNGYVDDEDLDYLKDLLFAGITGAEALKADRVADRTLRAAYTIRSKKETRITTYEYNAADQVTRVTDCNGNSVYYDYDSCGRLVKVTDQMGYVNEIGYDKAGNPVQVILPEGVTESYTYDTNGSLLTVTDAAGAVTKYSYDVYGRTTSVTDPIGVKTEYTYDIAGNVIKNLSTSEVYCYNAYDEVVSYTDAEGNVTKVQYDGQGNITSTTDALGNTTAYTYRKDGLLSEIKDASGAVTLYDYDSKGRVSKETDALGAVTTYEYDKENRVVKATTPNGTLTEYSYNTDSSVTRITATDVSGAKEELRYLYALDGSLTAAISSTDILEYTYDKRGYVTSVTKNDEHSIGLTYDASGNLTLLKELTEGRNKPDSITSYKYDSRGYLTEVYTGGTTTHEVYGYDRGGSAILTETVEGGDLLASYITRADGMLEQSTDGAGNVTKYQYNRNKQVTGLTVTTSTGTTLYSEANTYNKNGSLLKQVISGNGYANETLTYTYDVLDRLVSETRNGQKISYTYDSIGNRLTKTQNGVTTSYMYDLCNKLLSETTSGTKTTYAYDVLGNLTEKVSGAETTTYAYNALNQLIEVVNPDGTWQTNTYDASGLRSMIAEIGVTTEFVTFNGLVLSGYNKDGEQTEHYYYGNSLLAAECAETEADLYYYLKNSHGDVIGLTDNNGTLAETYRYDAFGTLANIKSINENGVQKDAETALSRFLYAGEQYDAVTGLYYLRARQYDTTTGRFTQEDTYLGDGRNLYVYVSNNPLKYVDPSGHEKTGGYNTDRINDLYLDMAAGANPKAYIEYQEEHKAWFDTWDFVENETERVCRSIIEDTIVSIGGKIDFVSGYLAGIMSGFIQMPPEDKSYIVSEQSYDEGLIMGNLTVLAADTAGTFISGLGAGASAIASVAVTAGGGYVIVPEAVAVTSAFAASTALFAGRVKNDADRLKDSIEERLDGDEGGSKTIDDIIDNLPETTNGKGVARNFESTGGFDQTIKDFDALNPTDVKEIQTQYGPGKVGKLSDGTTVVARPGSTTGGATLEIRVSNSKVYKIRY